MNQLHRHFIEHHLEGLREQADPEGCPDCEGSESDMRCHGCAEVLATIDAIESVTTEVSRLSGELKDMTNEADHWAEQLKTRTAERNTLSAEVRRAFGEGYLAGATAYGSDSSRGSSITEESAWDDFVSGSQCQHPVHSNPGLIAPCPECGAGE